MNLLQSHINQNTLANGYFVIGPKTAREVLDLYFKEGTDDYVIFDKETVGIEDVRAIKEKTLFISDINKKQIIVINANALTREAQSAFLKLTEEPSAHTHFIFFGAYADTLYPALSSRLITVNLFFKRQVYNKDDTEKARAFIHGNTAVRKKILEEFSTAEQLHEFLFVIEEAARKDYITFSARAASFAATAEWFIRAHILFSFPSVSLNTLKDYIVFLI